MVVKESDNGHTAAKDAKVSQIEEYCYALGGNKPIHSILIANNGMAAVKFIKSIRIWSYEAFGVERAVTLVAMATPEDMRINAEHIRMADQFIEVPGGTNNNNYANVQLIAEIAERTGVAAVWPGWGHASEIPELPEQLAARGIVFLGPPAEPMAALGDKIGSSIIAQAAGVPTMAWSGSSVTIPFEKCLEPIPDEVYKKACVYTTEEALASCQAIGYPVMIKASWGGGGKGIRKVNSDDEVRALFKQVQGEVPGSPIFTMKVATQSRHLEVQLLADQYGNVTSLHSRDCSVQRRHQKIIEEGPITVAPPETIKALEQGACRLARSVKYVGAATVEYLFSMETGEFYFLELNPRLQVEHPVTEWIAEVNIPAAQLCIGMGIPLWKMPEIRRFYGKSSGGISAWREISESAEQFDFVQAEPTKPKGHVVAVRVTSEDPDDGFKPTSGQVQELSFRGKPSVWAYFSVKSGGGIHEFSDSQFGHVFARGETRPLAIANMVLGLKELHIRGEIRTNVDYTVDLLHDKEYSDNKIHTGWLDSRIAMRVRVERPPWHLSVVGGALHMGTMLTAARVLEYISFLDRGQVPPKNISLVNFQVSLNIEGNKYTVDMTKGGPGSYRIKLNKSEVEAEVHTLRDGGLLVQLDGNSHVVYAEEEAAGTRLLIDGRTCLLQNDHDPSRLIAETPCKLLRFLVADGSHVEADVPYAEVEVMKMCMPLVTSAAGTIHCKMTEGSTMMPGDLIAGIDLDDPSAVKKATPFEGSFPPLGPPTAVAAKVHQRCAAAVSAAKNVLAGYEHNIEKVVQSLLTCLDDPMLPLYQWQEWMSILGTRLPKDLKTQLEMEFCEYETSFAENKVVEFPAKSLRGAIEAAINAVPENERASIERVVEPLLTLAKSYEGGRESHACSIVQSLFDEYLRVENLFSNDIQADVIDGLRQTYKNNLTKVVDIVLSHQGVARKNALISRLMGALVYPNPAAYREQLICFAELSHPSQSELALRASQLLEQTKLSELRSNIARSLSELEMFTEDGVDGVQVPGRRRSAIEERMEDLVDAPLAVEDALVALFDHSDHTLQRRVIETYIRRLYQPYLVKGSFRMQYHRSGLIASWQFMEENPQQANEKSSNLAPLEVERQGIKRWGSMAVLNSLHYLSSAVAAALKETGEPSKDTANGSSNEFGNIIHVALVGIKNQMSNLQDSGDEDQAQERVDRIAKSLKSESLGSVLTAAGVGIMSCIIQRDEGRTPTRHCFHWSPEQRVYEEESLSRHVEPPLSSLLELNKLKSFTSMRYAPSRDRQWHIYHVADRSSNVKRMFLRTLVRQVKPAATGGVVDAAHAAENIENSMQRALEEVELMSHDSKNKADHIHMYLSLLRPVEINEALSSSDDDETEQVDVVEKLQGIVQSIYKKLGARMHRLAVGQWEVRFRLTLAGCAIGAWRIVAQNPTGNTCTVQVYKEVKNAVLGVVVYHSARATSHGSFHGKPIATPHKPLDVVERRRLVARKNNTTYCFDFPLVFEKALEQAWSGSKAAKFAGSQIFKATELIFADSKNYWESPLVEVERPVAMNDVGMVGWSIRMRTPEFPEGRTIFVVSNDVTFNVGSFGQKEDAYFKAISDLAVKTKLPLIYLAANSGARIGVSDEVRSSFRVGWSDESSPDRGFQYLYLSPDDYQLINSSVVAHEIQTPSGEVRWVIDDIIGKEDGLGVENLSGSGAIAGAYSRAYQETFTLTYVSGRTVGIGAYLARLGMRCIQRSDQPIILTGYPALNKLLGREVYSSHMQLGGPKVMAVNGVTHLTVSDDMEGVSSVLNWLSYIPAVKGGPLPFLQASDPPTRLVEYTPETSCDPRAAIRGVEVNGKWLGGIFDKGSFVETLEGWAQTVVTGRARLGGIPVGIVAVETATVMQTIPADPGQPDTHERVVPQAGQVWFPDSASKTAQALLDFNKEGLPLFILANWRGFSGGQRDLFEGILQAGSLIVEHLRTYKQPVFVFIPKTGELRGGAWVVVDSKINIDQVEMYAERTAKGGVLEPEGLIEIKFREREMTECIHRLDAQVIALKQKLQSADQAAAQSIQQQINARVKLLLPVYKQIAIRFAELHDTANRMAAKGVIKKPVDWAQSRYFFHRRLKRRLVEEALVQQVQDAAGEVLSHGDALALIKKWYLEAQEPKFDYGMNGVVTDPWDDNRAFVAWGCQPCVLEEYLQGLRKERVSNELYAIAGTSSGNLKAFPEALRSLLQRVDDGSRKLAVQELKAILDSFK
ncbi:hypothetical protein R1flu_021690 [Riccia fluitans]|uniref:Acetyl-CoA carboxylase n=1 Tax=Riccia fluitans TaxID=41844 RepID=A0ABD1ZQP8_9MARC